MEVALVLALFIVGIVLLHVVRQGRLHFQVVPPHVIYAGIILILVLLLVLMAIKRWS